MACPYFVPTDVVNDVAWPHPSRLPLGAGWTGRCDAPGHEGVVPAADEIKEHCNMGYALTCTRLPKEREYDAVRFSVIRESAGHLTMWFIFESGHRPAGHGQLEYSVSTRQWISAHPAPRIQRLADCYLQSYLSRKVPSRISIVESDNNVSNATSEAQTISAVNGEKLNAAK